MDAAGNVLAVPSLSPGEAAQALCRQRHVGGIQSACQAWWIRELGDAVPDELGLELDGEQGEIDAAVKWIAEQGVKVEPIEKNVIE